MKYGVTEKGFVQKLYPDIVESLENKLKSKFGQEWELDMYSPEGALLLAIADEISKAWEGSKEAYFSKYLDTATGIQLDYKGKEEEPPIYRSQGKYATTTLEFTTSQEIVIPKNTLVKKRGTQLAFRTTSQLVINSSLKGQVQAIATETGSDHNCIIGEITEMGNNIVGVVSVKNIIPSSGGEGIENDNYYRERIRRSRKSRGGSTIDTITNQILNLSEVNNILSLENVGEVVDENGVQPGAIRIYIDGVASEKIAKVIHTYKAAGINSEGDHEYNIVNKGSQTVTERFYMMEKKQLYVEIAISSIQGELTEQIKTNIKDVVIEYIESVQKSTFYNKKRRIVINQIESRAYSVSNDILELSAKISLIPIRMETSNLDIPIGQYFYADYSTITVK